MFTITTGGHYQQGGDIVSTEDDYQIGYAKFLTDHLTAAIIKDYLISEKIVPYAFDSAI
jgi:hypothetical protein